MKVGDILPFLRRKDYKLLKELGQGACGKTVLLEDEYIHEYFVCKKYVPYSEQHRRELFDNFVREVSLLHRVFHPSVVRVFNYYLYPEVLSGFILMEYVDGKDIEDTLAEEPERIHELFMQAIDGFRYLERNNILHRDIRPKNILVSKDGFIKIIDLGFGKRIQKPEDFDKSVSLNLWCDPPKEFEDSLYDFRSEVYFVGKLFEKIIQENGIDSFNYTGLLSRMCQRNPQRRIATFFDVDKEIQNSQFLAIDFSEDEMFAYRAFSSLMASHITKIERGAKYRDNLVKIQKELEDCYRGVMLEESVPDSASILRCFIDGSYYYKKAGFSVAPIKEFLHLLKISTPEKKRIILANLHTRLDSLSRYSHEDTDDDIPF